MIHHPLNTNQVFFKPLTAADTTAFKNVKIVVPLKYLSNFRRSLETPLIYCKINPELNWTKNSVMLTIADTTFKITNTKIQAPIVLIHGRNFYDQPINDLVKEYDEIRKTAAGKGDDYTTGCLLDYGYFIDHYNLIAVDPSKHKKLDADSRAIQQIEFYGC